MRWGCVIRFLIIRKRRFQSQAEGAYRDGVNYQSVNVLDMNFRKQGGMVAVCHSKQDGGGRKVVYYHAGRNGTHCAGITVYNADIYPTTWFGPVYGFDWLKKAVPLPHIGSIGSMWVPVFLVWCIGRTTARAR